MDLYSIILAAGEGKRMKSNIAKPLQQAAGKALVEWVLDAAEGAGTVQNIVVVGHQAEAVKAYLGSRVQYACQAEQLGTGDAVKQGMVPLVQRKGTVAVLVGDTPLVTADMLADCRREHEAAGRAATVITFVADDPYGYGRIVRREGSLQKIVEQKDATPEEQAICECNSGMYFFDLEKLAAALDELNNDNAQGEYYATDLIEILLRHGETVGAYQTEMEQTLGVNDKIQLSVAERILNARLVEAAMREGVTVIDPQTVHITAKVKVGRDTVLYPGTILEGETIIGENCQIGPNTTLTDCRVGSGCSVKMSVGVESEIGDDTNVGPFAYLRPNSRVGSRVKIGDFVEVKNSSVGDDTKVAHLTYIGDADVGQRVNFGCGTVVVNYDGKKKHRTTIEDDCFIGCNTNLVSPVHIHKGAYTAAGSTITDEVPEEALAIARSRQVVKADWKKKRG